MNWKWLLQVLRVKVIVFLYEVYTALQVLIRYAGMFGRKYPFNIFSHKLYSLRIRM